MITTPAEPSATTSTMLTFPPNKRWFWPLWALAFVGFPIGGLAGAAVGGPVDTVTSSVLAGAATGAVIGAAQWLVLRRRLTISPWWIAATGIGMAAGMAIGTAALGSEIADASLPLRGLITGAAIGAAQTVLLNRAIPGAFAWGPVVAIGWALAWTITRAAGIDLAPKYSVFDSTGAWSFQLLTGLTLWWLLRSHNVRLPFRT